jgi:hypothetical protein
MIPLLSVTGWCEVVAGDVGRFEPVFSEGNGLGGDDSWFSMFAVESNGFGEILD